MRLAFTALLLATLGLVGCASRQNGSARPAFAATESNMAKPAEPANPPLITPASALVGKIVRYNTAGRFVVLEFPIGHLPALEQRMFVYRAGLKVGEVKVTGPQRDDHVVADLTNGEALAGDEVRDN